MNRERGREGGRAGERVGEKKEGRDVGRYGGRKGRSKVGDNGRDGRRVKVTKLSWLLHIQHTVEPCLMGSPQ